MFEWNPENMLSKCHISYDISYACLWFVGHRFNPQITEVPLSKAFNSQPASVELCSGLIGRGCIGQIQGVNVCNWLSVNKAFLKKRTWLASIVYNDTDSFELWRTSISVQALTVLIKMKRQVVMDSFLMFLFIYMK